MASLKPLRIGIVGVGCFGAMYVRALKAMTSVEVTWICDLNASRFQEVAKHCAMAKFSTECKDVCHAADVDAVVVATPEATHGAIVVAALEAGKHVLVEKPLATTDADAKAMIDSWQRSGKLLMTAHLLRFDYRYAQLKERLQEVAPVRNIYAYRNFDRRLFEDCIWRTHSFIENSIHDIDLILWYTGSAVKQVHAFCRSTRPDFPNPDINWGILEFENGVLAVLQSCWMYPKQEARNLQWNAGIQVMGDRGVLEVANDQCGFRINTKESGLALVDQTGWANLYGDPRGAFGAMLRHCIACMQGEVEYAGPDPWEAYEAMHIAQRLVEDSHRLEMTL